LPVETRDFITREMLRNEREKLFVFGDNLERRGLGGQAKEMRGEPNAVGIVTKKKPSMDEGAFFSDDDYVKNIAQMCTDVMPLLRHLKNGGTVVIPASGIGSGLSRLSEKAPDTFNFLDKIVMKDLHTFAGIV